MKRIWTIALRELRGLLDHPTGYILLLVFLGINNFLFFRQAYLSGVASIRPMLELMPWLLLFLVPAVTMRALAEDTRTGTLEVVLAQPLSEWEFLIGKYLGSVLFLWLALALTLLVPVGLSLGADLSAGVIVAQYVGAALLMAGMTGVGIWASSLTKNQITAFIIGVGVMFVLILVGLDPLIVGLPSALGLIAARLGVLSHFTNIGRGVIDVRDVIYFVSLGAVFVMLAYGSLQARRLSSKGEARKRLRVGVLVLVAAAIVVNLLGSYIGGRLDLTPGKAYTLARTTKTLVANLDDFLTIKLFASRDVPPQIALVKRDIDDLLRDLRSASNGNVRIVEFHPGADDPEARSTARALGIPAVQFNVVGEARLQIQEGFMGLAIEYAGGTEIIPFVRRTDDLEYQLATAIRGLTHSDERPVVGLLTSAQGQMQRPTYQALGQELSKTYDVRPLSLLGTNVSAAELDALIVAGHPDSLIADQAAWLEAFFAGGGSAMVMMSAMQIDPSQQMVATERSIPWNQSIEQFGVAVQPTMVYDVLSNEPVSLPTQFGRVLTPYPFWVRAASTGASIVNEQAQSLFLPWTSSIDTSRATPGSVTPLFTTSRGGGIQTDQVLLIPEQQFPQTNLATWLLAVMVQPPAEDGDGAEGSRGRLVLVGNSEFVADVQLRSAPENLTFVLNAVDWLAQDESLISIRSKDRTPPPLVLTEGKRNAVKYANLIGVPIVVILVALMRLFRRRGMTRRVYQPGKQEAA